MSILFSGDFHANAVNEIESITKTKLQAEYTDKYNDIKYHIILGDGGFEWHGNNTNDNFNYKALSQRPFPILCVIGNHEPFLGMVNVPEIDIGIGEKVCKIKDKPFIAYLKRGKIYTIDGFKMLVLGGALSIDKIRRVINISWWENEYWSEQEKQEIFSLLGTDNTFDYVISHTGPDHINKMLFRDFSVYSPKFADKVALLNDEIHDKINFIEWWSGHWHADINYQDTKTGRIYRYLYRGTKVVEKRR
ncbi:MAG: metallophosphoesterase [Treponema sp.]|nr:metallophosphoesterase [Treponema sp.]